MPTTPFWRLYVLFLQLSLYITTNAFSSPSPAPFLSCLLPQLLLRHAACACTHFSLPSTVQPLLLTILRDRRRKRQKWLFNSDILEGQTDRTGQGMGQGRGGRDWCSNRIWQAFRKWTVDKTGMWLFLLLLPILLFAFCMLCAFSRHGGARTAHARTRTTHTHFTFFTGRQEQTDRNVRPSVWEVERMGTVWVGLGMTWQACLCIPCCCRHVHCCCLCVMTSPAPCLLPACPHTPHTHTPSQPSSHPTFPTTTTTCHALQAPLPPLLPSLLFVPCMPAFPPTTTTCLHCGPQRARAPHYSVYAPSPTPWRGA